MKTMNKLKHTPGPWYVRPFKGPGQITCEVCFGKDDECITDGVYENADAKLIAAAPEMLDALIYFVKRCFIGTIKSRKTLKYYIEVIEKATGQKIGDIIK